MTIDLLTSAEAEAKPAGKARDEPNQNPTLDPPKLVCFIVLVYTTQVNSTLR